MIDRENNSALSNIKKATRYQIVSLFIAFINLLILSLLAYSKRDDSRAVVYYLVLGLFTLLPFIMMFIRDLFYGPTQSPFGFDYLNELSMYLSSINKKRRNKNKPFHYYSEWKSHIIRDYKELMGSQNFYRHLNVMLRERKLTADSWKTVFLPLFAVLIAYMLGFYTDTKDNFSLISIFIAAITVVVTGIVVFFCIRDYKQEIFFLEDLMEIVAPEDEKSVQS